MSVEEGTHTLPDGKQLYTKTFRVWWNQINKIGINSLSRRTDRQKPDLYSSMVSQMYGSCNYNMECTTNIVSSTVRLHLPHVYSASNIYQVNTYGGFFPHLASRGIEVYTFDQRCVRVLFPIFDTDEAQGMGPLCNETRRARRHGPD